MSQSDDIGSLLEFSRQQDELIEGHQKEMRQVLDNNRHLRSALTQSNAEKQRLTKENIALKNQNAQLKQRIAELEARPQFQVEQYIEQQHIGRQYYAIQRPAARKKHATTPSNQLPLWEQNASLM